MKKLFTILLAGVLLFSVSACGETASSPSVNATSSAPVEQTDQEKVKNDGKVSEKEALKLVKEQVLKDYDNEDTKVDRDSGQILDQNETAYLVGYDISDNVYGNHLYTEAYWINKKTRQIKDVCSINEYYEGLIDITNGESNF